MSNNMKKQKELTAKQKNMLIFGAGAAFVVVLTALILLALKFDVFGFQNGQPQGTTAPTKQQSAVTPDTPENPNTPEKPNTPENPENPNTPQKPVNPDENDFTVSVDTNDDTTEPNKENQSISFDDLMAAAGKNEETE